MGLIERLGFHIPDLTDRQDRGDNRGGGGLHLIACQTDLIIKATSHKPTLMLTDEDSDQFGKIASVGRCDNAARRILERNSRSDAAHTGTRSVGAVGNYLERIIFPLTGEM